MGEFERFLDRYPEAECDGFFWFDGTYRCVVSARVQKPRRACVAEFVGATPDQLVSDALRHGIALGAATHVAMLCESAPRSRRAAPVCSVVRRPIA